MLILLMGVNFAKQGVSEIFGCWLLMTSDDFPGMSQNWALFQ